MKNVNGITYKEHKTDNKIINVFLNGIKVGIIKKVMNFNIKTDKVKIGYQYIPNKCKNGGEVFSTLELCKQSLEEE